MKKTKYQIIYAGSVIIKEYSEEGDAVEFIRMQDKPNLFDIRLTKQYKPKL